MMKKNIDIHIKDSLVINRNIFLGFALIVLIMYTGFMDPINIPKMLVLFFLGIYSSIILIFNLKNNFEIVNNFEVLAILFFTLTLFISTLLSKNHFKAFFGETQRKNGFLSYFCLIVISLVLLIFYSKETLKIFDKFILLISITFIPYSCLQALNLDFISWSNPYNRVLGTAGNPNFAASILAILITLNFGKLIDRGQKYYSKIFRFLLIITALYSLLESQARQGLLLLVLAIAMFVMFYTSIYQRKFRLIISVFLVFIGLIAISGMLQIGPAAAFLYKDSVSVRGYYWRAAVQMFKANPWFGVGIDNYGDYFKQYREPNYSLSYGYDIGSSSAHNVYLQMFATGGIFVGLTYLLIVVAVLRISYHVFKFSNQSGKIQLAVLFTAWIQYQAQSLISIDNLTLAIWNWVLIGILIGMKQKMSVDLDNLNNVKIGKIANPKNMMTVNLTFSLIGLLAIYPISKFAQAESWMYTARSYYNPQTQDQAVKNTFINYARKVLNIPIADQSYKFFIGGGFLDYGYSDEGLKILKDLQRVNPRNQDVLTALAKYYEKQNNANNAIEYRLEIEKLDPWNAINLTQLGLDYKSIGKNDESKKVLQKILNFASGTKEAEYALANL